MVHKNICQIVTIVTFKDEKKYIYILSKAYYA